MGIGLHKVGPSTVLWDPGDSTGSKNQVNKSYDRNMWVRFLGTCACKYIYIYIHKYVYIHCFN